MAEYLPPTDNVPIFDVTNFAPSGSGLTEAQIASKFLRFPTGQGTETLPALITGSITAPNTMNIVMPNALASNVLNVGVVSRNISGQIHHYSDGDNCVAGAGVHINNGSNNASNTNISNGPSTTGTVNIMTGSLATGTIALGGGTTFNNITGTNTIIGTTNINTSSVSYTNIGNDVYATKTIIVGTTELNNTGSSTTNIGNTGLTTLNGVNVNINTLTGTDTTIGKNSAGTTSLNNPTVNLGRVGSSTTTVRGLQVNISGTTNDITGTTNINTTGTANTSIGVAGSTTAILGTTNINTSGTANTSIGIAGSTTAILGTTNINTSGTANTSIGIAGSTTAILGTTNINTTGTSATSIGATGSNVTLGTATGAGLITVNKPLTIGYATPSRTLAGLTTIGSFFQVVESPVTLTTSLTSRCYIGGTVPNGRYFLGVYVFIPAVGAVGDYVTKLAYANVPFSNGSTTGFLSALSDGQVENYFYKPNITSIACINQQNPQDVGSGFGYMAVAISGPASVANCKVVFNIVRYG